MNLNISINIKKKYLFFRSDARAIFRNISKRKVIPKNISLDFSGVRFLSRSFIDEFLNIIDNLGKEMVVVKVVNLNPKLRRMVNQVRKTKSEIRKVIRP